MLLDVYPSIAEELVLHRQLGMGRFFSFDLKDQSGGTLQNKCR